MWHAVLIAIQPNIKKEKQKETQTFRFGFLLFIKKWGVKMSSFTFNNQRKEYIQIEKGWSPPTW
ncbi:hypothetical protein FOL75_07240, partial [Bacillus thuringiensis]|nr:hypothetical protein [Bacillus thuringiensis]